MLQHIRHVYGFLQRLLPLRIIQIHMQPVVITAKPGAVDLVRFKFLNIRLLCADGMCRIIPGVFFLKLYNSVIRSV